MNVYASNTMPCPPFNAKDLVEDGSTWPEVVELAQRIEAAGASIINTGIGLSTYIYKVK